MPQGPLPFPQGDMTCMRLSIHLAVVFSLSAPLCFLALLSLLEAFFASVFFEC